MFHFLRIGEWVLDGLGKVLLSTRANCDYHQGAPIDALTYCMPARTLAQSVSETFEKPGSNSGRNLAVTVFARPGILLSHPRTDVSQSLFRSQMGDILAQRAGYERNAPRG